MSVRTHVLIAESFNLGLSLTGSTSRLQPPNRVDWASMYDELTWTLSLAGITDGGSIGSPGNTLPTAFSLKARFEYRQMHAGTTFRFQTPRWSNLSDEEIASHVVEGVGWYGPGQADPPADPVTGVPDGVIATQATTGYNGTTGLFANPIIVRRTLRHFPQGVRVNLSGSSFTGGTAPRFLVGLEVTGKRAD
jgi:hypothetical protein